MTQRPVNRYDHYHAHVYFDDSTLSAATALCQAAGSISALQWGESISS
jgi:aromatic ring-cleaving dioxygenase